MKRTEGPLFRMLHCVLRRLKREWQVSRGWVRDVRHPTYAKPVQELSGGLDPYLKTIHPNAEPRSRSRIAEISALADHYINHRFDLLGSGWVCVEYGMRCRGLEGLRYRRRSAPVRTRSPLPPATTNRANRAEARRIWEMVGADYRAIDWQLDFKSGYRWSERSGYRAIRYGDRRGVDIKVPWELARMQHLPQLIRAYRLASLGSPELLAPAVYLGEFRNQVLDFIASNPPRFGVNWVTAMDVSIRAVNWLVAYDMLRAYGVELDQEFVDVFVRSIYDHGNHIARNLEWDPRLRGNHYLANIAGLTWVGAYLPRMPESDAWLTFAVQELINEVDHQFTSDGANCEASTSYHRLSAEMVIYCTALVLGLPPAKQEALQKRHEWRYRSRRLPNVGPITLHRVQGDERLSPFPEPYLRRVEQMAEFTMGITKPTGQVPQIGDNDSGRFVKLSSQWRRRTVAEAKALYANLDGYEELPDEATYWDEDHLDHSHLVGAINGLFAREDMATFAGAEHPETALVRGWAAGFVFPRCSGSSRTPGPSGRRTAACAEGEIMVADIDKQYSARWELDINVLGSDLLTDLELRAYGDFGIYVYRSRRLYMAIRCGPVGQGGAGGHAHNDQLSLELNVDGVDWLVDPGTYVYTPLPNRRNDYRSVRAHFAPQWSSGREPGRLDLGLFRLGEEAAGSCLYFDANLFIGLHYGYGQACYRVVRLENDKVQVIDYGAGVQSSYSRKLNDLRPWGGPTCSLLSPSAGYGMLHR